ncbi:MAG: hypothetical protein JNN05_00010 [Candidatus Omnitrophica bacterium]|nr:hypothetical protein [Candidatus Omnitrophota bacterium]
MKRISQYVLIMLLLISSVGCTTRLVDFTLISTKNVDLTRAASFERGKSRVEGKDEASIIIFIPTGVPDLKEAIDRAIESVPGAVALVDGVLTRSSFYIPYIFGKDTFIVEGTPLIDPKLASANLKSNFMIAKLNQKGELQKIDYVDSIKFKKVKEDVFRN